MKTSIDELTIEGRQYVPKDSIVAPDLKGDIKIVILQRGWVLIGRLEKDKQDFTLNSASVIRKWGTSKGLGELALEGPKTGTILDSAGTVRFHELTVVAILDTVESKWIASL